MLVRLLVEVDMFSVFPYYGLEKEKKQYSLILSATIRLILHTPGPEIRLHVAYIYIDTPCAYPPSYPSIT